MDCWLQSAYTNSRNEAGTKKLPLRSIIERIDGSERPSMSGTRRWRGIELMKIVYCAATSSLSTSASASHRERSCHANARLIASRRWPLVSALCGCESRRCATHEPQSLRRESRTNCAMPPSASSSGCKEAYFFLAAVIVRVTEALTGCSGS